MKTYTILALLALAGISNSAPQLSHNTASIVNGEYLVQKLVVHEWGTFTCLQEENGNSISGINSDEAPLPAFTHSIAPGDIPRFRGKSRTDLLRPDITMRLETPVIYFHPPKGMKEPIIIDVRVTFKGGWLTEYFPDAEADEVFQGMPLTSESTGRLKWLRLSVGTNGQGPPTDSRVWTAPRDVDAANLTAAGGESERYLFYRGIGHLDAPVRVLRIGTELALTSQLDPKTLKEMTVGGGWFVDSRPDGTLAFRRLNPFALTAGNQRASVRTSAEFEAGEFAPGNLGKLRAEMHKAIVADGLFADEAEALLNTWEVSYFKSAGQRVFFLVPAAWTNAVLPLDISRECKLQRTMIARIELVTPDHREALAAMAAAGMPKQPLPTVANLASTPVSDDPMTKAFYSLGRFRNALVRHAEKRNPAPALTAFLRLNRLDAKYR
jgi:hypothetical protein